MSKQPRYDVPKAAPPPLRLVQSFVNTVDLENEREWLLDPEALAAWAHERRLVPAGARFSRRDLAQALALRESLRALLRVNGGAREANGAFEKLTEAARRARFAISFERGRTPRLEPRARGIDGLCGQLVAVVFAAMLDGSWSRLKACRNCRWAFYDESKNRSARWCSMTLCGNRLKTRAYRRRSRAVS